MRAKRWMVAGALAGAVLLFNTMAQAQSSRDDEYDDENDEQNYALGVGIGLVEPADEVENYLMASLRIRFGNRSDGGDSDSRSSVAEREGIRGYLEPEVGYWESSDDIVEGSDLLLGVNLIGVVPLGSVDSFFGVGAGVHFIDEALLERDPDFDDSATKIGANAQFGLDIRMTRSLSVFGAGRFDLVQGSQDSVQSKVYLGLRGRF